VLPPGSNPFGQSYADWSVRWWQWAYGLPVTGHPLFDETGIDCGAGQSGPVWFLGGVFNVSGTVVRDLCTVPAGKALFFPIVNVEWDDFCPPDVLTPDQQRAAAKAYMDAAVDLHCEIDGRAVQSLTSYRVVGPSFGIDTPDDNIWQFFGCPTPAGHYAPLFPDGYFVMLAPLAPGAHTLHFKGTIGPPVNFTPEATYHLTVAADPTAASYDPGTQVGTPVQASDSGAAPANATWGKVKSTYR
jgi:hypothetical protein